MRLLLPQAHHRDGQSTREIRKNRQILKLSLQMQMMGRST
jgi:hypothetical protein